MSNRRRLRTPAHVAAADQAFAHARQLAATEPTTGVVVMDYAAEGRTCAWCPCPPGPDGPHVNPEHQCAGCQLAAVYDIHAMVGTPDHAVIPTCEGHLPEVQRFLLRLLGPSTGSIEQYPPG